MLQKNVCPHILVKPVTQSRVRSMVHKTETAQIHSFGAYLIILKAFVTGFPKMDKQRLL